MVYVVRFIDGTEHEFEGETMTEVLAKISEYLDEHDIHDDDIIGMEQCG